MADPPAVRNCWGLCPYFALKVRWNQLRSPNPASKASVAMHSYPLRPAVSHAMRLPPNTTHSGATDSSAPAVPSCAIEAAKCSTLPGHLPGCGDKPHEPATIGYLFRRKVVEVPLGQAHLTHRCLPRGTIFNVQVQQAPGKRALLVAVCLTALTVGCGRAPRHAGRPTTTTSGVASATTARGTTPPITTSPTGATSTSSSTPPRTTPTPSTPVFA
jgi:hypothetical protein